MKASYIYKLNRVYIFNNAKKTCKLYDKKPLELKYIDILAPFSIKITQRKQHERVYMGIGNQCGYIGYALLQLIGWQYLLEVWSHTAYLGMIIEYTRVLAWVARKL